MACEQSSISKESPGRFYGVGIGPGDPELITLRAYHLLLQVPVIIMPVKTMQDKSMAGSIIAGLDPNMESKMVPVCLPMSKDKQKLEESWRNAAYLIRQFLCDGKDVAFINIGDPLIYGTFIYIAREMQLSHPDVAVEVIPGISSINAAAARTVTPLACGDETIAIISGNPGEMAVRNALENFDTIIFLKISACFAVIGNILKEYSLAQNAVYICRCTGRDEKIISGLDNLKGEDLDYMSLLIVRK